MDALRRRLSERCEDVCDWVDYRPDADFRPFLVLPLLFAFVYASSTAIGLEILLALAAIVTALVSLFGLVTIAGWVVANALLDVTAAWMGSRRVQRVVASGSGSTSGRSTFVAH